MSAEFAMAERCPEPPDLPSQVKRISEIRELNQALKATDTLDAISYAAKWTDIAIQPGEQPSYYLIKFNTETRQVDVEPYFLASRAIASYDMAESSDNESGKDTTNVVLVEADKIESLKNAYPNYFGDVQLFKLQLNKLVKGRAAEEYIVRPQETDAPRPRENPDIGWLKRRFRRWK
jgi:hypothetical protein